MIFIFVSFHHMAFLTLLAPRRNPCAETARLSLRVQRGSSNVSSAGHGRSRPGSRRASALPSCGLDSPSAQEPQSRGGAYVELSASCGDSRLVLECVEPLSPLGDPLDVLPHHILRLVNLLLDSSSLIGVSKKSSNAMVSAARRLEARFEREGELETRGVDGPWRFLLVGRRPSGLRRILPEGYKGRTTAQMTESASKSWQRSLRERGAYRLRPRRARGRR
jgi:hypothetical protein